MSLSHLDESGAARMVDVGGKRETARSATATGRIAMSADAVAAVRQGDAPKGDVLASARIAGIMAAKKTAELIPLCHPLALDAVSVEFVFEPNDRNTWIRVKSMIENYLTQQWKAGALMGTTTREAYFVKVGLNETMTELDVWEGRMIVEIGLAVVRPAEFIILRFMHKMLQES